MRLSFLESVRGCEKTVQYERMKDCGGCRGTGVVPGSKEVQCTSCKGTGQKIQNRGGFAVYTECGQCQGVGKINPNPCKSCGGSGATSCIENSNINVPPGTPI